MQSLHRNLLTAIVLLLPAQLIGQGLTVQSVVDTRVEGALGSVVGIAARMSGQSLRDVASTTYLQRHQLRTDNAMVGTVYDLDAERMINIDHKQKTYSSTTFAEMAAAMERARASAEQARAKEEAKAAKAPDAAGKKGQVNVKYNVKVDRPGQHEKIAGYDAERVFITVSLEAEAVPEGEKAEQVGTMVFLLDQWIAKNAPQGPAFAEFYRLFAQKVGREFRSQVQGLQAVFASDPRVKEGFEAAAKEMQKVQGIPLRSSTHVILVPVNMTLNRQLALDGAASSAAAAAAAAKSAEAAKAEKPKSGFGGFLTALKNVAEDASKKLDSSNQDKNAPPKQMTLLVMVDEVKSISTGAVPAAMFAPPADYREVKPKTP